MGARGRKVPGRRGEGTEVVWVPEVRVWRLEVRKSPGPARNCGIVAEGSSLGLRKEKKLAKGTARANRRMRHPAALLTKNWSDVLH